MSAAKQIVNDWTGKPWCRKCNRLGCVGGFHHYRFNFSIYLKKKRERFWKWWRSFDYSKIDDIEVDGIDTRDYPDFCDAYISSATYKGKEMTESQLERLNEDRQFVYEQVQERLY